MLDFLPHKTRTDLPRFGQSTESRLRDYRRWLHGEHRQQLTEADFVEPRDIYVKVRRTLKSHADDVTLKKPGDYVFTVWDNMGFARRPAGPTLALEAKPKGFFWSDMQYLDHFEILPPDGEKLKLLEKSANDTEASFTYTLENNPPVKITRHDRLDGYNLYQQLDFVNRGTNDITFTLRVGAAVNDIFQARTGGRVEGPAVQRQVAHSDRNAGFSAFTSRPDGGSTQNMIQSIFNIRRETNEHIELQPVGNDMLEIKITVPAGGAVELPLISHANNLYTELQAPKSTFSHSKWMASQTGIRLHTSKTHTHLQQVFDTAARDIERLTIPMQVGDKTYFPLAAGIPNFTSLFGRDSIITAMQVLPFNPLPAKDTLKVLAHYQGNGNDPYREMEPGKILHELRYGEMTRLGMTPHGPYYGTMDATPLFVMLMAQYVERTGDTQLLEELWPNLVDALSWINDSIVDEGPLEGFLAQRAGIQTAAGTHGLKNIGWKDSGHAMRHLVNEEGKLTDPEYPLAPAEVQGYVYGAWQAAAKLFRMRAQGKPDSEASTLLNRAAGYEQKAGVIRQRFNKRYWMPDKNFMATALQGNGKQLPSVSTNGTQALLTGIVDEDKAAKMVPRLMEPDMLSGWGIRTLSSNERAFDPLSYQNGGIWPHDNALIVAGLARYGYKKEAAQVASQLFDAAKKFPDGRLPEVYAGFTRKKNDRAIIPYPDTCSPQAWAAGTPFMLLSSLLGLKIDGFAKTATTENPRLPQGLKQVSLTGLPVPGAERVDLEIK